jgi:hypothetical protein
MGLAATTVVAQAQCYASAAQQVSAVAGGGGSISTASDGNGVI